MNWNQVIHEFKASGLSQAAFCRQRKITYGTFNKRLIAFNRSELPEKVLSSKPASLPLFPFLSSSIAWSPFVVGASVCLLVLQMFFVRVL